MSKESLCIIAQYVHNNDDDDHDDNNNNNIKSGIVVVTRPVSSRLWSGKRELLFAAPVRILDTQFAPSSNYYSAYHCSGDDTTRLDGRVRTKCVCLFLYLFFHLFQTFLFLFSFFDTTTDVAAHYFFTQQTKPRYRGGVRSESRTQF